MFQAKIETITTAMNQLMKVEFTLGHPTLTIESVVSGFRDKNNLIIPLVKKQIEDITRGEMPTVPSLEKAVLEAFPDVIEGRRTAIVRELTSFINDIYSAATKPGFLVLKYIEGLSVSDIEEVVKGDNINGYILQDAHLKGFDKDVMTLRIAKTVSMLKEVLQDSVEHQYRNDLFGGNQVPDFIATRAFSAAKGADTEPFNADLTEYMKDFFMNFAEMVNRQLVKERHKFMETHTAPVHKPKPAPKYTQYMTLGVEEQKKLHAFLGHNSPDALVIAQREDGSIDFLVNYDLED